MKIKVDYVTNSSSEIFGIVLQDSGIVGLFLAGLSILFEGCQISAETEVLAKEQIHSTIVDTSAMAQQIAAAVEADAKRQEELAKGAYSEAENALAQAHSTLERELEETKRLWEESERTADKTDPGYAELKKQYEDYMNYLNTQIQQANYQKQMVEYEQAQIKAQIESRNEWIRQQQTDLIAVKEEKAMLEAVAKGYNLPGYDTSAVKTRLQQLSEREKEIANILSENNASIEYKPVDRGSIGPSQDAKELNEKIRAEKKRIEAEKKAADKEKRKELDAQMEQNIKEFKEQMARGDRFEIAEKAAQGVQFGADIAIEGLAAVTGPTGEQIKLAYTAGKSVASGMGEGMADPKNATKHLAKGILNAGTEVLKEKLTGGDEKLPWHAAAADILNEGLQGGLEASIKGKDADGIRDAMGKGLTKGVFTSYADNRLDALKDAIPMPKGSSTELGEYSVSKVLNNNPLTKGVVRTTVREGGVSKIEESVKEAVVDKVGEETGFVDREPE